jgi:hypothetical protein
VSDTAERGLPRPVKAGLVALALIGLLVLVALGSRASHPGSQLRVHQREVPAQVGNDLLTLAIVVYGLGVILVLTAMMTFRHEWRSPRSRWLRDLFLTLLVCGFVTLVGYRFFHNPHGLKQAARRSQAALQGSRQLPTTTKTLPDLQRRKSPAHFDWPFAVALLGFAGLTAAYFLVRRGPPVEPKEESVEEELSVAVGDAIEDLRGEADARRAVIAAYARMEAVLGRHGRARRAAEAPYEYLARVLLDLRIRPSAVKELTDLFERAKFSAHQIDTSMKERAIAALVSVREDLQVPA